MYDQQLSASMRGGQYGPGKFKARRQGSQSVQSPEDTFQPDAAQGMVQQLPQAPVDYAQWGRNEQKVPQAQDPLQSAILGSARRGAQQGADGSLSSILAGRQGGMTDHRERWPDTSNAWHSRVMPNGQTGLQMADEYRGLIQGDSMSALQRALGQQGQASGASAQAQTPQYDASSWNTEGWATPQYLGKAAGGPMAGWDQTNWDDPNMQTPKYVVGRILSNYTPTIEGLGQAMAEIQQAYPGAEFDGKDKITIPGLGTIDALVNAGGENSSWGWQDLTNNPGTGGPGGQALQSAILGTPLPGAGAPGAVDPMPTAQGANQYLQQLIQMLQGYGYQVPTGGIPTY